MKHKFLNRSNVNTKHFKSTFAQAENNNQPDLSEEAFKLDLFKLGLQAFYSAIEKNKTQYQMAYEFWKKLKQSPTAAAEHADKLIEFVKNQEFDKSEAEKLFKSYGMEYDFQELLDEVFETNGVPNAFYSSMVVDLWPKVRSKGASFRVFVNLLSKAIDKFGNDTSSINNFFVNTLSQIQESMGLFGDARVVFDYAFKFLNDEINYNDLKKNLFQLSVIQYGLTGKRPTQSEREKIESLSDDLSTLKQENTYEQERIIEYNKEKGILIQENNVFFRAIAEMFRMNSILNFKEIADKIKNKQINFKDIDEIVKLFNISVKSGQQLQFPGSGASGNLQPITPPKTNPQSGIVKENSRVLQNKRFAKMTKNSQEESAAEESAAEEIEFINIANPFMAQINAFEDSIVKLENFVDNRIKRIFDKGKGTSGAPGVGIFKADAAYSYLFDTKKSLEEADKLSKYIEEVRRFGSDTLREISKVINDIKPSDLRTNLPGDKVEYYRKLSIDAVNKRFQEFFDNLKQKELNVSVDIILLEKNNEISILQKQYDRLKVRIKEDPFIASTLAPKALSIGFKIANILEEIANSFRNLSSKVQNANIKEQMNLNYEDFINFSKEQRAFVVTEIYPAFAQVLGLDAVKPEGFSSTFPLSRGASSNVKFKKFANDSREVESDKKFRNYWNSLFMQSKDPVPMGDIIEEKPKHGELTTKEDAKLHKKTMKRFKKHRFKNK